jgi:AraC-like DNA-binding protein
MVAVFTFNGSADSLAEFAASVQGRLEGDLVRIDRKELSGDVRRATIDNGLSVINCTLTTREACTFRNKFISPEGERCYLLTYFFEPAYSSIVCLGESRQIFTGSAPALLIMARTADLEFNYPAGVSIRCVSIALTEKWLEHQAVDLKDHHPVSDFILRSVHSIIHRSLSRGELFFSKELYSEFHGQANSLLIRTHVYNLLSVLYRHIAYQARHAERRRGNPVIWQVEKELLRYLQGTPPSIDDLARKFFLSPSTLQRHFKSVFGINAYEYYLRKKMEEAKKLLRSGQSVNAVSYALGYESVSHFIRIFKKIVGANPGKFKKMEGLLVFLLAAASLLFVY